MNKSFVRALRPRPVSLGLLVALCLTTPALADAPGDQYEDFTKDDQAIMDVHTKLRWRRSVSVGTVDQATAVNQCSTSPPAGTWRLPTVKELLTIVDEEPNREYDNVQLKEVNKYIDDYAFRETPTDAPFWTSTIDPKNSASAFVVQFSTGIAETVGRTSNAYFRCVRNEGP